MGGPRKNWLYRLCLRRVRSDLFWEFVVALLNIPGILINRKLGVWSIGSFLILLGTLLPCFGLYILVDEIFPKLRDVRDCMSEEDLMILGDTPTEPYNVRYYITDRFLCDITAVTLVRLSDVETFRYLNANVMMFKMRDYDEPMRFEFNFEGAKEDEERQFFAALRKALAENGAREEDK